MTKKQTPPQKVPLSPPASKLDTLTNATLAGVPFKVCDPEYAFDLLADLGTILCDYRPCDPSAFELNAIQGIGFFAEHLANAGKAGLFQKGGK